MRMHHCLFTVGLILAAPLLAGAQPMLSGSPLTSAHKANGVAAVVEDRVITIDDVRQEIALLIPQLQQEARNEIEFQQKLRALQDEVVQSLVDRVLIVKHFKDQGFRVPQSYIEQELNEIVRREFDGDRARFLRYLESQGQSVREFRRQLKERMIVQFMRGQMRRSETLVSPRRMEEFYEEKKHSFFQEEAVHLRIIHLRPITNESEDILLQTAEKIDRELRAGADFGDLARQYSQDNRRREGGNWGWIRTDELRDEWREMILGLEKGQHTEPLKLPEGLFILYVQDRREAGIQPIHEVREQIESLLVSQMARESHERWLERLRRNAYVRHYL